MEAFDHSSTIQNRSKPELPEHLRPIVWPSPYAVKRCSRCLYPETIKNIKFNESGVCSYCEIHDQMNAQYPTGAQGDQILQKIVEEVKAAGRGNKYDCVVGVSGGCDSTYMLHRAKELGLRPLAAHFDNTWNSAIATENIYKVLKKLNVDLFTIVVDNKEYDDIYHSFMKAGVTDLEAPTDLGLAVTLYRACEKYKIKYMWEGHSFRTEGISPLGWLYMDGRYIKSVHKQFGKVPMKTFPNMPLSLFLKWMILSPIKKIRPLYYTDYDKEKTKDFLAREYGWKWYGGHHLENRFTAFWHTYFFPRRYQIDTRILGYSAMIRSGQMPREEGIEKISKAPEFDAEVIDLVMKRLGLNAKSFMELMSLPMKTYKDYPNYKKTFERLRPLFYVAMKLNKVPQSFYIKFTSPDD